ncbi:hypothetical protein NFI96_013665, partial [Prochilodus magdalenae]
TGGYYFSIIDECITSSSDLSDVEYIRTQYFNKDPVLQFNSTVGEFIGFTEFGMKNAERFNHEAVVQEMRAKVDAYCKHNLPIFYSAILDKSVKPKVKLTSEQSASGDHPALLMCSAYKFYPPVINVYWLRDGKQVTGDVVSVDEMANGDWYYQVHSHLEYIPRFAERISCVVEHASLEEPIIYDWGGSLPEPERNKIAIGTSGLVFGIILSAAGFIYYRKKSSGRILVPNEDLV